MISTAIPATHHVANAEECARLLPPHIADADVGDGIEFVFLVETATDVIDGGSMIDTYNDRWAPFLLLTVDGKVTGIAPTDEWLPLPDDDASCDHAAFDGNADDPSYLYCDLDPGHAGDHHYPAAGV